MSLLRRLRGASLLVRFGAISLLLTLAVGVVLSSVLSTGARAGGVDLVHPGQRSAGWTQAHQRWVSSSEGP